MRGIITFGEDQIWEIIALLKTGNLYSGSDGSGNYGRCSHAYRFTSGKEVGGMYGGAALNPGSSHGMPSLRAEHGGAVGILLILHVLYIFIGDQVNSASYHVDIWIDNAEVLERGGMEYCGDTGKESMVLDYDLWIVMTILQTEIQINIHWYKVDSCVNTW